MSCNLSNAGAPAAGPVGPPLQGGSPNVWNEGAGNFLPLNQSGGPRS